MKKLIRLIIFIFLIGFAYLINSDPLYDNKKINSRKLQNYFNGISSSNEVLGKQKNQFVIDSLANIKKNSTNISFVEITEFTDSMSIKYVTLNKQSYNYFVQLNSEKSKHIGTTYIGITQDCKTINNDLNKIVSLMEAKYQTKATINTVLGDYLLNEISDNIKILYLSGSEYQDDLSLKTLNGKYSYEYNKDYDESIFIVEHLLQRYGIDKYKKLWKNGFSNFEKIYGKSFKEAEKQRVDIAKSSIDKNDCFDWCNFYDYI